MTSCGGHGYLLWARYWGIKRSGFCVQRISLSLSQGLKCCLKLSPSLEDLRSRLCANEGWVDTDQVQSTKSEMTVGDFLDRTPV